MGIKAKKPFNFYWIYAIIGVVLISLNLFNWNGNMTDINLSEFEEMVKNEEVDRVVVYNKLTAEVFLKKEALKEEKHAKRIKTPLISGAQNNGPHYKFDIGPADSFQEKLDKWGSEYNLAYDYKTRSEWGKELFTWILFIGIMIAVWMFVMRRIGGGGGAGGQIFNIGKSRAQLFDKTKGTNVTFNDVAGLEGAKEEIQEIVDFLKNPKRYTTLGAKIPKGALLNWPSRYRKDPTRQGGGGRSTSALLFSIGFRLCRDVRRGRCISGARPVQASQGKGAGHNFYR